MCIFWDPHVLFFPCPFRISFSPSLVNPLQRSHLIQKNWEILRDILLVCLSAALWRATPFPGPPLFFPIWLTVYVERPVARVLRSAGTLSLALSCHAAFGCIWSLGGSRGPPALLPPTPGAGARYPHAFRGSPTSQRRPWGPAACVATVFALSLSCRPFVGAIILKMDAFKTRGRKLFKAHAFTQAHR